MERRSKTVGEDMIDYDELKKTWDLFVGENSFTEVRILGKFAYSGYFKSFDNLCKQLEPFTSMDDEQIYFVLNSIDKDCYARPQCERFVKSPKVTTTDSDIIRRKFLLLDFDPIRKSQTNSSDVQFELAHKKAQDVYRFLIKEKGFTDSIICISGNGWHIIVPVDLPCDEETNKVIKDFYTYMGSIFSDENVEFDEKVYTNARLTKLYSTWAKKGANVPSNPWRQSKIVYIPKELTPTPLEKIKELADLAPKEEPRQTPSRPTRPQYGVGAPFDIEGWLKSYGIEYRKRTEGSSVKYEIKECPWRDQHSVDNPYSSVIYQDTDGKLVYSCAHSHCKNKTWFDFRQFYEPDAYTKPVYQPQPRQFSQQRPKYEIKEEVPELGKKWLSMDDIKKVDLASIPRIKTGITELDRHILGLAEGEVTLMSGSNASGKSSFLNTLLLNAIDQGVPSALFSGELPAPILKSWIQMPAAGKRNLKPSLYAEGKYYVPDEIGERIDKWMKGMFFLFNNEYGNDFEELVHDAQELLECGVRLFVFDNLMATNLEMLEGDKLGKQKEAILRFKEFAAKNNVHVILVAHPRKSMAFLRKMDISGTADLTNAVDNVFICHRCNQDFFKAGAEFYGQSYIQGFQGFGNCISIEKNRQFGVCDVLVGMHYEIESRRFKNTEHEDIQYGWEGHPTQATFEVPATGYTDYYNTEKDDEPDYNEYEDDPLGHPMEDDY